MSFPIASLRDDFTDNVQGPLWASSTTVGSGTKSETAGQAVLSLPSSVAGSHSASYATSGTYDLTGGAIVWNIAAMVATGVAANAFMQLITVDQLNQLYWKQLSNSITCRKIVAGVDTQLFTATWSASTYKYLRIRESAGTVYWDSSTDGISWTNRVSAANPFAVTALIAQFAVSCGNVASPGSLKIEEINQVYPASSATWRETTADWGIVNRLRSVTLAVSTIAEGVIVTADSMDETTRALGGTLHFYGGPLGSTSGGFLQLTEYASLALAEASPFNIPLNGRVDLPAAIDARYMRLYHRSTDASPHILREFMPRRLVQADDVEAESITAINIAAATITADKLFVLQLSAITADVGTLNAGTINGVTIYAGGSNVRLDSAGTAFNIATSSTFVTSKGILWEDFSTGADAVTVQGWRSSTYNGLAIRALADTRNGLIELIAASTLGSVTPSISIDGNNSSLTLVQLSADKVNISGDSGTFISGTLGLHVGSGVTGAGTGQIKSSGGLIPGGASGEEMYTANHLTLANNAIAAVGPNNFGFVFVHAGGKPGIYALGGGGHVTIELSDPSAGYSITAGTAGMINIYWSAGNARYEVENKTGGTVNIRIWQLDAA